MQGWGLLKQQAKHQSSIDIADNVVQQCLRTCYVSGVTTIGGKTVETVWLCKICGEEREMWRKSGAWFFKVRVVACVLRENCVLTLYIWPIKAHLESLLQTDISLSDK